MDVLFEKVFSQLHTRLQWASLALTDKAGDFKSYKRTDLDLLCTQRVCKCSLSLARDQYLTSQLPALPPGSTNSRDFQIQFSSCEPWPGVFLREKGEDRVWSLEYMCSTTCEAKEELLKYEKLVLRLGGTRTTPNWSLTISSSHHLSSLSKWKCFARKSL